MATHSRILAWEIPWTGTSGGLQSMRLQRVGHDLVVKQQALLEIWVGVDLYDCDRVLSFLNLAFPVAKWINNIDHLHCSVSLEAYRRLTDVCNQRQAMIPPSLQRWVNNISKGHDQLVPVLRLEHRCSEPVWRSHCRFMLDSVTSHWGNSETMLSTSHSNAQLYTAMGKLAQTSSHVSSLLRSALLYFCD